MIARLLAFGARTAGGLPFTVWIIAGLMVAMGGLEVTRRLQVSGLRTDLATERAARATEREQAAAAALRQAQANAEETARRVRAQQEMQRAHDEKLAGAQRDAAAARTAAGRLREQLAAYAAAHRGAAADPALAGERAAAASPVDLLADLLGRVEEAGRGMAEHADRARIAGQQCEAAYDSLSKP